MIWEAKIIAQRGEGDTFDLVLNKFRFKLSETFPKQSTPLSDLT